MSHCTHVDAVVDAVALLQLPALHRLHAPGPVDTLYVPGAHGTQVGAVPVSPAPHSHWLTLELPSKLFVVPGHASQTSAVLAPVALLYVLTGHCVHAVEEFAADDDENVPAIHDEHALLPGEALNVPLSQSWQTDEPGCELNRPAAHSWHEPSEVLMVSGLDLPAEHKVQLAAPEQTAV